MFKDKITSNLNKNFKKNKALPMDYRNEAIHQLLQPLINKLQIKNKHPNAKSTYKLPDSH